MQEAAEGSAAARRRAGFLGERRLLSMPLPRHLGLRKCLYCPRKKSWPGVFLLCLGTLKGIPVGTIISHMASQKQNKTKQKKAKGKKKKEREKEKKSKVTWMLWPSTGKGEIHQLALGDLETCDQSNSKLRTSSGPVKTIERNPSLCILYCRNKASGLQMKWKEHVCKCGELHGTRPSASSTWAYLHYYLYCSLLLNRIPLRSQVVPYKTALSLCSVSVAEVRVNSALFTEGEMRLYPWPNS